MIPNCIEPGCEKIAHNRRGWCVMHYTRWRRHGSPETLKQIDGDVPARFWDKVDTSDEQGCWIWTGAQSGGYGQVRWSGRARWAHRIAYELSIGPIPDGLQLDHLCRVKLCVNPAHLEPVTTGENTRRGIAGWQNKAKTHCPRGHPYSADNTDTNHRGWRWCLTCRRERYQVEAGTR